MYTVLDQLTKYAIIDPDGRYYTNMYRFKAKDDMDQGEYIMFEESEFDTIIHMDIMPTQWGPFTVVQVNIQVTTIP